MIVADKSSLTEIRLFGEFHLRQADGSDATPTSKKARALIAYVALSPNGAINRDKLAGLVWSTRADKQARDSLRQALTTLRRETRNSNNESILSIDRELVRLSLDKVWVDAREVERLAKSDMEEDWRLLLPLYTGDLLESLEVADPAFADWILVERRRFQELVHGAVQKLIERRVTAGDVDEATEAAKFLLALDGTNEEAHRVLMRLHAAKGDTAAALRQYQLARDVLKRELDVTPSPETEALFRELKEQKPQIRAGPRAPAIVRPSMISNTRDVRVVVLPFYNRQGDSEQDSFTANISQAIEIALSRFRWIFVVGHTSSKELARHKADVADIGRNLSADYVLSGSIQYAGQRMKVAVELVQSATARTVWADQYIGVIHDIFEAEDRLAAQIAARLDPELLLAEVTLVSQSPPDESNPRGLVMRAVPLIYKMSPQSVGEADELLKAATRLDPKNGLAYTWRTFCQLIRIGQQWVKDTPLALEEINWLSRAAIELHPEDAVALALRGHIEAFIFHNYNQAIFCFDRALKLNPNSGFALAFSAVTHCYLGNTQEALLRLERYHQLSPFDPYPFYFHTADCIAYALSGQYEKAAQIGRLAVGDNPNYFAAYRPLIASLGHLGKVDEARTYLKKLLENEPHFTLSWLRTKYPPLAVDHRDQYIRGLRKAGVPNE
jgi:DNA-binding SARP family transcriptional activator/TolB-like protein